MKEDKIKFINELTVKAQLCSNKEVMIVYDSLVKLISHKLREKGEIELPHLGKIYIRFINKSGISGLKNSKSNFSWSTPTIKFKPFWAFNLYFKKFFQKNDSE